MKKLILLVSLVLSILSVQAEELKVTTIEVKDVNYENGMIASTQFRILCINGYKWLQYNNSQGSVSQMFEFDNNLQRTMPIRCKN